MSHRRFPLRLLCLLAVSLLALWACSSSNDAGKVDRDKGGQDQADKDAGAGESLDPDAGADPDGGNETVAIQNALEWYYGQRTVPGTALPAGARTAAVAQANAIPLDTEDGLSSAAKPAWTSVGPTPIDSSDATFDGGSVAANGWKNVSGRVTALAAVPTDKTNVYAGGADGGVWHSTDGGTTWTPVGDQLASLAIGAISVSAGAGNAVWVGTGEANTSSDSYYGAGIYVSKDGGATWSKKGGSMFNQATVFKIALGKHGNLEVATNHGLYQSTDDGKTFQQVLAPGGTSDPYGNFVTDVTYLPGSNNVVALIGWRGGDTQNGIWQSTDGGTTFKKVKPTGFAPQANQGRMSIAAATGVEYIVVQDAVLFNQGSATHGLNGVYKSTTGPKGPWTKVAVDTQLFSSAGSAIHCYGEYPGVQAWYDEYVTIDPTNSSHVVLGLEEIYDSSDGGSTWKTIGRYSNACGGAGTTTHPDQHAATWAVVSGKPTVFVGSDGGVWKQTGATLDNASWTNLNTNLSLTQPYYAEPSSGPNPVILAGTQDNGNVKYSGSNTWKMTKGGDGADVIVNPATPNDEFGEYVYLTVARTTNGGQTWTNAYPPDAGSSATARFIAPIQLDPTDSTHIVALGRHVWESHAGWSTISSSWTSSFDNGANHVGTAVDVQGPTIYEGWCGPCNPDTLTSDSPFASGLATNQGGTWHTVTATGLPNRYISGVLIDPANKKHVWVAMSGFSRRWIPGGGLGHVFESTDGGATFTDISANLPDAPANDFVLSKGKLVVATDVGVFRLGSTGTWKKLGAGLPMISVLDLAIEPGTDTIVAATHGRGVWTLAL